jgi:hypothetical protein
MDGMYNPQAFRTQQTLVYTLEEERPPETKIRHGPLQEAHTLARNTVEVEMRHGEERRRTRVPSNVSEEQMVQILVNGFGENVRKQWRVKTRNLSRRVMENYALNPEWSYELIPQEEPAPPMQSKMVKARTRYQGLNWDIDLEESWSQGRVWEAVVEVWKEELKKRSTSAHPEKHGPTTEIETRDEQGRRVHFGVHEGWTYVLQEKDWKAPEWVSRREYKPSPRVSRPDVEVLIGMQLEDGMRIEQKVQANTEELRPKRIMWQTLDPPEGQYYLHIRNARNEDAENYEIGRQWTYILRKQRKWRPVKSEKSEKSKTDGNTVNVRLRTSWQMVAKHVNTSKGWDEQRAIAEFKKLAGVQQSLACKLRIENQEGEKVPFEIHAAFTYTLAVAH